MRGAGAVEGLPALCRLNFVHERDDAPVTEYNGAFDFFVVQKELTGLGFAVVWNRVY